MKCNMVQRLKYLFNYLKYFTKFYKVSKDQVRRLEKPFGSKSERKIIIKKRENLLREYEEQNRTNRAMNKIPNGINKKNSTEKFKTKKAYNSVLLIKKASKMFHKMTVTVSSTRRK